MRHAFSRSHRRAKAFTLIEMIVSMAIMILVVLLFASVFRSVNSAWVQGEQQVEIFQNGRAILELITRELSQALISPNLQLIDSPVITTVCANQAPCSSLFWQAPLISSTTGNVCEVGYYLTRQNPTGTSVGLYQLERFFIAPNASTTTPYLTTYPYLITSQTPSSTGATWLTGLQQADFAAASSVVSDGVLAFWVRCIDQNGYPIPWMTSTVKFNSAGFFQPAQPNTVPAANVVGMFPPWTSSTSTSPANRLPAAVEITIVTVDSKTLAKKPVIPSLASYQPVNENDIQNQVNLFNAALLADNVKTARTFISRIDLVNASR
jgi:type II secretory pathway pseudopilin PulG